MKKRILMLLLCLGLSGCTAAEPVLSIDADTEKELFRNQRAVYDLNDQGELTVKILKDTMELNGDFYTFDCHTAEDTNMYEVTAHNENNDQTVNRMYDLGIAPVQVNDVEEFQKHQLAVMHHISEQMQPLLDCYGKYDESAEYSECVLKSYRILWDTTEFDGDHFQLPVEITIIDGERYVTFPISCYRKENGAYMIHSGESEEMNLLLNEVTSKYNKVS